MYEARDDFTLEAGDRVAHGTYETGVRESPSRRGHHYEMRAVHDAACDCTSSGVFVFRESACNP